MNDPMWAAISIISIFVVLGALGIARMYFDYLEAKLEHKDD